MLPNRGERSKNDRYNNREVQRGGGCDVISEETKKFFLESVDSAALLWCTKAISSDDFFKILKRTVNETEKKMKIDPEAWTV